MMMTLLGTPLEGTTLANPLSCNRTLFIVAIDAIKSLGILNILRTFVLMSLNISTKADQHILFVVSSLLGAVQVCTKHA